MWHAPCGFGKSSVGIGGSVPALYFLMANLLINFDFTESSLGAAVFRTRALAAWAKQNKDQAFKIISEHEDMHPMSYFS